MQGFRMNHVLSVVLSLSPFFSEVRVLDCFKLEPLRKFQSVLASRVNFFCFLGRRQCFESRSATKEEEKRRLPNPLNVGIKRWPSFDLKKARAIRTQAMGYA